MPHGCRQIVTLLSLAAFLSLGLSSTRADQPARPPNIIFIMADDLGYGDLGCYGQKKIRTPHIDRIAAEGMKFTQFYSGSAVCAPTRCVLMTGLHTGHAYIRDNRGGLAAPGPAGSPAGAAKEGQEPIPPDTVTIGRLLQRQGYATACIGKWGLGGPGSTGEPNRQGFDHFFGYLCQAVAHNHYPTHLWRNTDRVVLEGNEPRNLTGKHYAHDLMAEEALGFIRKNKDRPFFLYLAWHIPHLAIQAPDDDILRGYQKEFGQEQPYDGKKGYLKHPTPRAALAAMITRMDRDTGQVMALLKELKLDDHTVVFFTSDNGGTWDIGGVDPAFFNNNGPLRGFKGQPYEGGIRVPLVARWPGKIKPGAVSDHLSAHWDVLPTLMEIAGAADKTPKGLDGISMVPTLRGQKQPAHDYLYWELGGWQAVRMGDWKLVKPRGAKAKVQLYNLKEDLGETKDVADANPQVTAKMTELLTTARTESKEFPLVKAAVK
jgi:arylsulfatase